MGGTEPHTMLHCATNNLCFLVHRCFGSPAPVDQQSTGGPISASWASKAPVPFSALPSDGVAVQRLTVETWLS